MRAVRCVLQHNVIELHCVSPTQPSTRCGDMGHDLLPLLSLSLGLPLIRCCRLLLLPLSLFSCLPLTEVRAAKQEPIYQFQPVLKENKTMWQFLHSLLMLLSFCFLLPLGSLLARHKWMFGRDDLSVRPS